MYQKKREADIRCPLEYGLEIFGGKWDSRGICMWAGLFKREDDSAHLMAQCQKCDFHRSGTHE